jgi:putative DNA primase/helicase
MLTERLQRAAILQLAEGRPPANVRPVTFEEPWRTIYLVLERKLASGGLDEDPVEWAVAEADVIMPSASDYWEQVDAMADSIRRAERSFRPRTLGEVARSYPPVEWLWHGWLPRGMLSLLAGEPGTGKSHWTLDLVRVLQNGGNWPDGSACTKRGAAVWIEGEGIAQEINERAVALGIDPERIYVTTAPDGEILNLLEKAWQDEVVNMVATVQPALIVVDSLSTITDKGQDRSEQVTPLLLWLVGLARWSGASVLLIHHLRKGNGSQMTLPLRVTLDQIRGSGQIAAQARAILAMSHTSTERDQPRLLDLLKKTISRGKHPKPLSVAGIRTEDGEMICRFEYGEAPKMDGTPSRDECAEWLVDLLEDNGPMRLKEILEEGEPEGYNKSMVWRARKALGGQIVDTDGKQNPRNRWALASWDGSDASDEADEDVM